MSPPSLDRVKTGEHRMIYAGGDSHDSGVGLILDAERAKCILGFWALSFSFSF